MEFEKFWKIIHILCEVTLRKVTISKLSKDIFDFTLKIKLSFCVGAFHEFLTFSNNRLSCKSFKIECTNLSLHNVPKDFDSHGWISIITIHLSYVHPITIQLMQEYLSMLCKVLWFCTLKFSDDVFNPFSNNFDSILHFIQALVENSSFKETQNESVL